MAKVTSKLQVTIPKALATRHKIEPGDEVTWMDAGDFIRLEPVTKSETDRVPTADRLQWFDDATDRQRRRQAAVSSENAINQTDRGWSREELYGRGRSD